MRNEAMLKDFIELVTTDAVTGQEDKVAAKLAEKLEALGFTVTIDNAGSKLGSSCGNLIAVRNGELNGSLLFSSHMDRMPNGFGIRPVEKDGVMYSDGTTILAADDMAGACAILNGLRETIASGEPLPRLEAVFTIQEEKGARGSSVLDMSQLQSKIGYVFDAPGVAGRSLVKGPGACAINVELTGKPAHAGNEPENGIDAAKALATMLSTLHTGRLDFETTSNFPILHGISVTNSVCDKAGFRGEARSRNREKLEQYIAYFKEHCCKIAKDWNVGIEIAVDMVYPPLNIAEDEPVLTLAKAACERVGITYTPEVGGGGLDANNFSDNGIRSIGCGCGYAKNHTTEEYLILEEFFKAGQMCTEIIKIYSENLRKESV